MAGMGQGGNFRAEEEGQTGGGGDKETGSGFAGEVGAQGEMGLQASTLPLADPWKWPRRLGIVILAVITLKMVLIFVLNLLLAICEMILAVHKEQEKQKAEKAAKESNPGSST